jgi:mycothiol synthase
VRHRYARAVNAPKGYTIAAIDLKTIGDAEIEEAARFRQEIGLERVPEDPLTPLPVIIQGLRAEAPGQWRATFVARDAAGRIAGSGFVGRNLEDKANLHIRWCEVGVRREHRRKGLGRALFATLVEACEGQGTDVVFISQTSDRVPAGGAFAGAIGAAAALPMKINQLDLRTVDRAKVAEWARLDPPGYGLERIDDTVSDRLMRAAIDSANAINDMPKGEMAFNDFKMTEAMIRQRESFFRQAGKRWWLIVAVDAKTGDGVGFTEVVIDPRNPHEIEQEGTAVVQAHRGHQLGLWMKAAMLQRILAELPESRFIRTGNANVNAQMIRINEQLGFRYAWQMTLWQIGIADARKMMPGRETARA